MFYSMTDGVTIKVFELRIREIVILFYEWVKSLRNELFSYIPVLDTKESRGESCYSQLDHFYYGTRSFCLFLTLLDIHQKQPPEVFYDSEYTLWTYCFLF